MIKKILSILDHGLSIYDRKLHTKFNEDFHDLLAKLRESENATGDDYFDSEIDLKMEKLLDYMDAYELILKNNNNNN